MPSGEIFTGPVEDSASGRLRCGFPVCRGGRGWSGSRWSSTEGRVVSARAEEGEDYLRSMLDLDPGARRLGELGLGLNAGIDRFTGSILYDEKIGGTVHLALGQSYPETGGRQRVGPALGPDRRHPPRRPDHRRRPGRDGGRALEGGLTHGRLPGDSPVRPSVKLPGSFGTTGGAEVYRPSP